MCAVASGSAIVPDPFITTLDPAATLGGRNNLSRSLDLSKVPCLVPAAVDCDHTTVPISSTATTALKQTLLFILPPSGGFLDPQTRRLMRHRAGDWLDHTASPHNPSGIGSCSPTQIRFLENGCQRALGSTWDIENRREKTTPGNK